MRKKAEESDEFRIFWEEIWRPHARHTDGRGLARDAFHRHVSSGADPRDIVDGARGFFRFMPERDRPYVPLVATWLNREAYTDWAERERAYQRQLQERESGNVVNIAPRYQRPANHFLNQYKG